MHCKTATQLYIYMSLYQQPVYNVIQSGYFEADRNTLVARGHLQLASCALHLIFACAHDCRADSICLRAGRRRRRVPPPARDGSRYCKYRLVLNLDSSEVLTFPSGFTERHV